MKRILSVLLAIVLIVSSLSVITYAYDGTIDTYLEAVEYIREQMIERQTDIEFEYHGMVPQIDMNDVFAYIPSDSDAGDYLRLNINSLSDIEVSADGTVSLSVSYYTTKEQEDELNTLISSDDFPVPVASLHNEPDILKVKTIFDFICDNVTYDYDNVFNDEYTLKHTAYAAMMNGKAVCQGYTLLFEKLALESGLEARIALGSKGGENHAWNIVKLGDKWYLLDTTYGSMFENKDDYYLKKALPNTKVSYEDGFTPKEIRLYPFANTTFEEHEHYYKVIENVESTCIEQGYEIKKCTACGEETDRIYKELASHTFDDSNDSLCNVCCIERPLWSFNRETGEMVFTGEGNTAYSVPWNDINNDIKSVSFDSEGIVIHDYAFFGCNYLSTVSLENVTEIGSYAFALCDSIVDIEIPASVNVIGDCAFHNCHNLERFTVDNGNTKYFNDNYGVLFEKPNFLVKYPSGSKAEEYIPEASGTLSGYIFKPYAFSNCDNLKKISFEKISDGNIFISQKAIPAYTFYNCENLETLILTDSSGIENYGIYECSSLRYVGIRKHTTNFKASAFEHCTSLEKIVIDEANTGVIADDDGVIYNYAKTKLIYCPANKELHELVLNSNVSEIGDKALANSYITDLSIENRDCLISEDTDTIPKSVTIHGYIFSTAWYYANKHSNEFVYLCEHVYDDDLDETCNKCGELRNLIHTGKLGTDFTWAVDYKTGILEVLGQGKLPNYNFKFISLANITSTNPIAEHKQYIKEAVLDEGITSVGKYFFYSFSALESVRLPESLTEISDSAFASCGALEEINIPAAVETIAADSFINSSKLSTINVDERNKYFSSDENGMLYNADKSEFIFCPLNNVLKTVTLLQSVSAIGYYAFYNSAVTDVYIFNNNCDIYDSTFTIPKKITIHCNENSTAYQYAQKYGNPFVPLCEHQYDDDQDETCNVCGFVREVIITGTYGNSSITWSFNKGTKVLSIEGSGNTPVFPVSVPWSYLAEDVISVVVADAITSLPILNAFKGFVNLKSVKLSAKLKALPSNCFEDCRSLESVTIPASVSKVEESAFNSCNGLKNISVDENNSALYSVDGVLFLSDGNKLVKFPSAKAVTSYTVPMGTKYIASNAFEKCSFEELILPAGLETISKEAIKADNLKELVIPDTVTSIGKNAVKSSSLTKLILPQMIEVLETEMIYAPLLESLIIPDSVKTIHTSFLNSSEIKTIDIPQNVENIDAGAFALCENLEKITVDGNSNYFIADANGVLYSRDSTRLCFCPPGCGIEEFTISEAVTQIDEYAFYSSNTLTDITFNSVTCDIADSENTISKSISIHGYDYSTSQAYAEKYERNFISLGCAHTTTETVPGKQPTCFEEGYTQGTRCVDCGGIIAGHTAIKVLLHTDNNGDEKCDFCNVHMLSVASGQCGDNLIWSLSEGGILTIDGTGISYDYEESPFTAYAEEIKMVYVKDGVTSLTKGFLTGCKKATPCFATNGCRVVDPSVCVIRYSINDGELSLSSVAVPKLDLYGILSYGYLFSEDYDVTSVTFDKIIFEPLEGDDYVTYDILHNGKRVREDSYILDRNKVLNNATFRIKGYTFNEFSEVIVETMLTSAFLEVRCDDLLTEQMREYSDEYTSEVLLHLVEDDKPIEPDNPGGEEEQKNETFLERFMNLMNSIMNVFKKILNSIFGRK